MDKKESTRISKFLAYVLRHNPDEISITLDESGWVVISDLLAACAKGGFPIAEDDLRAIVAGSDKQRFAISEDGLRIRANQGHSVTVELGYEAATPPAVLYHGTAERFVTSIQKQGLIKGARHHVHLTESVETASATGSRYGKLHLLTVDAGRMHADGFTFYVSTNRVWLVDTVPPAYINFASSTQLST